MWRGIKTLNVDGILWNDGHTENSIPPKTLFCGGYNYFIVKRGALGFICSQKKKIITVANGASKKKIKIHVFCT